MIGLRWVYGAPLTFRSQALEIGQIRHLLSESTGDLLHVGEGDILLCTLNHADIGSVYARKLSQTLLGVALLLAFLSNTFSEMDEYLLVNSHTESVASC